MYLAHHTGYISALLMLVLFLTYIWIYESCSSFNWPKRLSLLERKIAEICLASKRHTLIDIGRTIWIARIKALQIFDNLYPAIMLALKAVNVNKAGTYKGETYIK